MEDDCRQYDVVLVWPPFAAVNAPPIGLSILKRELTEAAINSTIKFCNIDFYSLSPVHYNLVANGAPAVQDLVGEWIFAERDLENDAGYLAEILGGRHPAHKLGKPLSPEYISAIQLMADRAESFAVAAAEEILRHKPKIVGFSSVFQQTLPSVAIANAIKHLDSSILIVFGGANCEGSMGAALIQHFRSVDAVVSGEAEFVFKDLCKEFLLTGALKNHPQISTRVKCRGSIDYSPSKTRLESPVPDYADFKIRIAASDIAKDKIIIPFETSRGCWWGAKHHCIFCGLNGEAMSYRRKERRTIIDEVDYLGQQFPDAMLFAVDNIVHRETVKCLADRASKNPTFFECKSNLNRSDFEDLQKARITELQIGIESLSTRCLAAMKKGVTGIKNIQTLRLAREFGVRVYWNLLVDIPGVDAGEYDRQADMIDFISHLEPPSGLTPIRIDRFSPMHKSTPTARPYPAYNFVFGPDKAPNLAYFFFEGDVATNQEEMYRRLTAQVARWKSSVNAAILFKIPNRTGDAINIFDSRTSGVTKLYQLGLTEGKILDALDSIQTLDRLASLLALDRVDVAAAIDRLLTLRLIFQEEKYYLSIVPRTSNYYPGRVFLTDKSA